MTVAVGDYSGFIQIYHWVNSKRLVHKSAIPYDQAYKTPLQITFSFFHGSQLLLIGGEKNEATVVNLATETKVAKLMHEGKP
jgi:hypothetical protein